MPDLNELRLECEAAYDNVDRLCGELTDAVKLLAEKRRLCRDTEKLQEARRWADEHPERVTCADCGKLVASAKCTALRKEITDPWEYFCPRCRRK